jgi:hypothetical protein
MNKPNKIRKFVNNHKTAIAFFAGATLFAAVGIAINRSNLKITDGFLEEKGLLEEFNNL